MKFTEPNKSVLDNRLPAATLNEHCNHDPDPAVDVAPPVGGARPLTFCWKTLMTTNPQGEAQPGELRQALLLRLAGVGLILVGWIANNISLASGSYVAAVSIAIVATSVGVVALIASWAATGIAGRNVIVVCGLVGAWTLVDAMSRRIPALIDEWGI